MQSVITTAFETYLQDRITQQQPVVLDEIVLANIPDLDPDAAIPQSQGMPPAEQIVYRQDVDQAGALDTNAVAYSIMMDTSIGDFDFNAIILSNKTLAMAAMIVHKETESKIKTAAGQQGNSLVKTMVMEYDGATEATGITVTPATWQIDLSEQFAGKSDVGHGHGIGDVSGLQSALDGKSDNGHSHAISGVNGLQSALDGKSDNGHNHAISGVNGLQSALDGKSDNGHNHAISGVNGLQSALDGKSATSHTHTPASIGAAAASHGHGIADINGLQDALAQSSVLYDSTNLYVAERVGDAAGLINLFNGMVTAPADEGLSILTPPVFLTYTRDGSFSITWEITFDGTTETDTWSSDQASTTYLCTYVIPPRSFYVPAGTSKQINIKVSVTGQATVIKQWLDVRMYRAGPGAYSSI